MKKNLGGRGRTARAVVGSSFLAAALLPTIPKPGRSVLFALSAVALGTALRAYCPANSLLRLNSAAGSA